MQYNFENIEDGLGLRFRRSADEIAFEQDRNAGTESPKPTKNRPLRNSRTDIDKLTDKIEPLGTASSIFRKRFLKSYVLSVTTEMPEDHVQIVHDHNMDKLQICAEQTLEQQTSNSQPLL